MVAVMLTHCSSGVTLASPASGIGKNLGKVLDIEQMFDERMCVEHKFDTIEHEHLFDVNLQPCNFNNATQQGA